MTKTLSEAEALDLIKNGRVGRLGCIDRDQPYVVPINYVVNEKSIYSHSLPGRKIEAMRASRRVCLQTDRIDDDFHWRSAIAFGVFEEVHNPKERREILTGLLSHFPKLTPVESMIVEDPSAPDPVVFRIIIDRVTGVEEA